MKQVVTRVPVFDPRERCPAYADVQVEVNVEGLARRLARRAINARSQETTIGDGAVTVSILSVEKADV